MNDDCFGFCLIVTLNLSLTLLPTAVMCVLCISLPAASVSSPILHQYQQQCSPYLVLLRVSSCKREFFLPTIAHSGVRL